VSDGALLFFRTIVSRKIVVRINVVYTNFAKMCVIGATFVISNGVRTNGIRSKVTAPKQLWERNLF